MSHTLGAKPGEAGQGNGILGIVLQHPLEDEAGVFGGADPFQGLGQRDIRVDQVWPS